MMQQMKQVLSHKPLLQIAFINFLFFTSNILAATIMPSFGAIYFTKCNIDTDEDCELNYIQYNFYNSLFSSIQGVVAFLFTGYVGSLSDCIGRKLLIFMAIFLCFIPRCIMIFYPNLFLYFVISILFGFSGGKDALPPTFQAFVSDILPQELKTLGFGILFASIGIGLLVGSITSMILTSMLDDYNYQIIWIVITVLYLITMLLVTCLKESLLPKNRKSLSEINIYNPFEPLLHVSEHKVTFWVAIIYFVASLPTSGIANMMLVYISDQLNLDGTQSSSMSSILLLCLGASGIFGNTILLPFLKKTMNFTDINIVKIVTISSIIWCIMFGLLPYIQHIYIAIVGVIVGGNNMMAYAALNGILTTYVEENEQGNAFGVIQTSQAVTATISPFIFGVGYNFCKELELPVLPFVIAMIIVVAGYLLIEYKLDNILKDIDNKRMKTNLIKIQLTQPILNDTD